MNRRFNGQVHHRLCSHSKHYNGGIWWIGGSDDGVILVCQKPDKKDASNPKNIQEKEVVLCA